VNLPLIMGVVNVTPDSFSDGGRWLEADAAVDHGLSLRDAGAALVDVGGESTRPGAARPTLEAELARVVPVVRGLAAAGLTVSVDTMRAAVAEAALAAGATLVNDVSGGLADPAMAEVVAAAGVEMIAMHWRGHSADMQSRAHYDDVVVDVCRELAARVDALTAAGIPPERILLDPGLGFAKTPEHNWALLRRLEEIAALGHRVVVGTSRKRFLGVVGRLPGHERAVQDRDVATAVTSAYAASAPVWAVRVHDVVATRDAFDVVAAMGGGFA
jgi:dihydropteroate synthase